MRSGTPRIVTDRPRMLDHLAGQARAGDLDRLVEAAAGQVGGHRASTARTRANPSRSRPSMTVAPQMATASPG